MLLVVVMAVMAVGLVAMPSLSEQALSKNFVSESKNKGQQGELKFDVKGGGLQAPNDANINNRSYAVAA